MQYVTYNELTAICGKQKVYSALLIIERAANVETDNIVSLDCEKRLRRALEAMLETRLAA